MFKPMLSNNSHQGYICCAIDITTSKSIFCLYIFSLPPQLQKSEINRMLIMMMIIVSPIITAARRHCIQPATMIISNTVIQEGLGGKHASLTSGEMMEDPNIQT